jgi:hypothetical protein
MPKFTKSSTMSTTDSSGSDLSQQLHAVPTARTNRESVEVAQGAFSKPRVPERSRRYTSASAKSARSDSFRYYGRHGNQWLFNDFSVTESVKKGWGRVFGKDESGGDWYEKRN